MRNVGGGACINYAFFSMCGTIDTQDNTPDPGFDAAIFPGTDLTVDVTGTTAGTHDWVVYISSSPTGPWASPITFPGPVTYNGPFPHTFNLNAIAGYYYRVVHRVTVDGCAACCEVILFYDNNKKARVFASAAAPCGKVECEGAFGNAQRRANPTFIESVKLTPNPATDVLRIDSQLDFDAIRVIDAQGKLVLSHTLDAKASSTQVEISELPVGVYFLQLQSQTAGAKTAKFIIKR